jgi:threonine/homoserine/homoserine lactone efflux protein
VPGLLPPPATLLVFLGASLLLAVVPGPAVVYIVTRSISQGRTAGVLSAAGVSCGGFVHIAAAALGLSVLVATSVVAFSVVKYAGAVYLVYLGIRRLRAGEDLALEAQPVPYRRLVFDGAVVNVLNPKSALFFYAFLPQFVDPARGHVAAQIVALGLVFVTVAFSSDATWAVVTGSGAAWLRRPGAARFTRRLSGGILVALGIFAALVRPARAAAPI